MSEFYSNQILRDYFKQIGNDIVQTEDEIKASIKVVLGDLDAGLKDGSIHQNIGVFREEVDISHAAYLQMILWAVSSLKWTGQDLAELLDRIHNAKYSAVIGEKLPGGKKVRSFFNKIGLQHGANVRQSQETPVTYGVLLQHSAPLYLFIRWGWMQHGQLRLQNLMKESSGSYNYMFFLEAGCISDLSTEEVAAWVSYRQTMNLQSKKKIEARKAKGETVNDWVDDSTKVTRMLEAAHRLASDGSPQAIVKLTIEVTTV